ncbi:MAG TPA: nicotinate dehydrogenase medium molybdopterin subunit [Peptococcaceae bacterium]|nr:MAG: Purine hydroxylase beta subunit apoprotein [Moorella sp. 60_41]HBT47040.1 nicotinate dehydrogenase medium molybdopterin subunit [Peptococcaceae bacterium]
MAKKRGTGMACIFYGIGYGNGFPDVSTALVEIHEDGSVTVRTGAADCGQGSSTIMAQIAAEEIGVALDRVTVVAADTDATPDAGTTAATRQTYVSGNAVRLASRQAADKLLQFAARELGVNTIMGLKAADGYISVLGYPEKRISIERAAAQAWLAGVRLVGEGTFTAHTTRLDENGQGAPYWPYAFGVQVAEVEVDTDTGEVKVLKIIAAHDVGRAINRGAVEGQIAGGVAMGLGLALMEEVVLDEGRIYNPNLHGYLIPTTMDMPEVEPIIIEDPEPTGPYGAKGVGEPATLPTAPAILNAIYNAVGVRLTELPATPERVLKALKAKEGQHEHSH